jgi:hypothetical protein
MTGKTRTDPAAGMLFCVSHDVVARLTGRPSIPEPSVIQSRRLWDTGSPAFAGDDTEWLSDMERLTRTQRRGSMHATH